MLRYGFASGHKWTRSEDGAGHIWKNLDVSWVYTETTVLSKRPSLAIHTITAILREHRRAEDTPPVIIRPFQIELEKQAFKEDKRLSANAILRALRKAQASADDVKQLKLDAHPLDQQTNESDLKTELLARNPHC
ncbi:hypothetical protein ANCCEY_07521 [Ancylostoma ceylanicum]|uniref:Uncharacterized protein n=1 Tax=Ancylostoma ceylanicum TaxID=53326 RepID=A0A0D6LTJ5_9BILA|nr:hypothetical protein ANCCEY_07521 [Ancylostoma ceylanicum]